MSVCHITPSQFCCLQISHTLWNFHMSVVNKLIANIFHSTEPVVLIISRPKWHFFYFDKKTILRLRISRGARGLITTYIWSFVFHSCTSWHFTVDFTSQITWHNENICTSNQTKSIMKSANSDIFIDVSKYSIYILMIIYEL